MGQVKFGVVSKNLANFTFQYADQARPRMGHWLGNAQTRTIKWEAKLGKIWRWLVAVVAN